MPDLGHELDLEIISSCISGMAGPIDVKQKYSKLISC